MKSPQIFLSYAGEDAFEAMLLKDAIEALLRDIGVRVWAFGRDQARDQRSIGTSLKEQVQGSVAVIILLSSFTLESGATQWMELAYADAFGIPAFILLHHLTFDELRRSERGTPPLVLEGQCTIALEWRSLENGLRSCCTGAIAVSVPAKQRRKQTGKKKRSR